MPSNIYWNPVVAPSFSEASQMMQQATSNFHSGLTDLTGLADAYKNTEIAKQQAVSNSALAQANALASHFTDPTQLRHADFSKYLVDMLPDAQAKFTKGIGDQATQLSQNLFSIAQANAQNAQASKIQSDQNDAIYGTYKTNQLMKEVDDLRKAGKLNKEDVLQYKFQLLNRKDANNTPFFKTPGEAKVFSDAFDNYTDSFLGMHGADQTNVDLASAGLINQAKSVIHYNEIQQAIAKQKQVADVGDLVTKDLNPTFEEDTANAKAVRANITSYASSNPDIAKELNTVADPEFKQDIKNRAVAALDNDPIRTHNPQEYQRRRNWLMTHDVPMSLINESLFNTGKSKYNFNDLSHGIVGDKFDRSQAVNNTSAIYLRMLDAEFNKNNQADAYAKNRYIVDAFDNHITPALKNIAYKNYKKMELTPSESNLNDNIVGGDPNKTLDIDNLTHMVNTVYSDNLTNSSVGEGEFGGKLYLSHDHFKQYMDKNPTATNAVDTSTLNKSKLIGQLGQLQAKDVRYDPNNPAPAPAMPKSGNYFIPDSYTTKPITPPTTSFGAPKYITPSTEAEMYFARANLKLTSNAREFLKNELNSPDEKPIDLYRDPVTGNLYSSKDMKPDSLIATKKNAQDLADDAREGLSHQSMGNLFSLGMGTGVGMLRSQIRNNHSNSKAKFKIHTIQRNTL